MNPDDLSPCEMTEHTRTTMLMFALKYIYLFFFKLGNREGFNSFKKNSGVHWDIKKGAGDVIKMTTTEMTF